MRILGIAHAESIHTRKWASYFVDRGHVVRLISVSHVPPEGERDPRVEVDPRPLPSVHLKRMDITLRTIAHLRRAWRAFRPDLAHAHYLGHGAWYAALARLKPLAISVMGGGDVRGAVWAPANTVERLLTPYALSRAGLVTCWSPALKQSIEGLVSEGVPCEVILGGVDVDRFRRQEDVTQLRTALDLPADAFVVLGTRLLWPLHNADVLVRAVALARRELPQVRLLLVRYRAEAFPHYERDLQRLVGELGVGDVVRFLPAQPNGEMPALYSLASCTASIPDVDGTPMTVMESLACGTPAVISDLPDYDPALMVDGETVLRVPHKSPEALAAAFLRLANDEPLRRRLQAKGREMVERRASYSSEMRRLEALYERLAPPASRPNGSTRPAR